MRRRLAAWLFGVVGSMVGADAAAMGLGAASLNSALGEPLRLSFPVSSRPDEDIGCVQVRARGDDLPSVLNARTSVIRNGFQTRVEVRSAQPIDEPAIGLVVSVGCTSPISREYVVFLDPPVIPPLVPASESTAVASEPARAPVRRPATRRAQAATEPSQRSGGAAARGSAPRQPRAQNAAPRPPRLRAPAAPAPTVDVAQVPQAAASKPAAVVPAPLPAPTRDRLTVAPNEAQTTPPAQPPAVAPSTPAAATASPTTAGAVSPGPAAAVGTPAVPVAADAGEGAAAREQALRQQQADLQQQIKSLSDQIAALRVQTTSLVTRNEMLERSSFSPMLIWLLLALAVIAVAIAGWMAWRYTQLRKSIEGSAWWTGNTTHAVEVDPLDEADARDGLPPLDAATRMAPRVATPTDVRASAPAVPQTAAVVSNLERSRPVAARNTRYPAAIDTDFTVSDIEAAMATVRTVSPTREPTRPNPVADSDYAPLGGPTLPSPYAEPPPAAPRASKVVERDGENIGKFVDLEIPPLPPAARQAATPRTPGAIAADPFNPAISKPAASTPAPSDEETEPLDFKLDIPHAFDPLGTDSMKTTIVDRAEAPDADDLELSGAPTPLDFELPSATSFATTVTGTDRYADDPPARHGATALGDLFPSLGGPGADTILDLDERDGAPLSTTEVDRLLTTAVDGNNALEVESSTRARMARFADLMNQVDDAAVGDPLRAIAHLRQFVLRDEQIPTLLWLRLFELYKTVDKKPVYEALAEHFSRRYHRPMVGWTQTLEDRVPQTPLAAMGAIDREIESLWGKEEGLERIRSLLCDRDHDDAVVFNAVLQRDLLDAAKVFPRSDDSKVA